MNIIRKKCMLITPCNVTFKTSSGKEIKPNTKSIEFISTKEILVAMNSGIRVFEIGSDGKQVQLDKSNFDKINVLMNYPSEEEVEEKKEETVEEEAPNTEEPVAAPVEAPVEEPKEEEDTVDPAEEESPSDEDDPEDEEIDMTPQEDPEAKYYNTDSDSKDDCDEENEDGEDDEFNND